MNEPDVLNSLRLPARLDVEKTARLLGCKPHDIPTLVAAKLLTPLGNNHASNSVKWFAACQVRERASDVRWLSKACNVISEHWQGKNRKRQNTGGVAG